MKIKILMILLTSVITFSLTGCGKDYEWDTNNISPLSGMYEDRNRSLDLNRTEQEKQIEALTQRVLYSSSSTVGISISVLYPDNTAVNRAYGCAKLSSVPEATAVLTYENGDKTNCETPLTINNRFKVGSLTKTTIGKTVLDIDDNSEYDFDLSDPITKHLPSNILALGDFSGITVAELLHHTSGLNAIDFEPGTVEEILTKVVNKGRLFYRPGQVYKYNNTGYIVLGEIIKFVTGSSHWQGEVQKRVDESIGNNSFIFPESGNTNWLSTPDTAWFTGKERTLLDSTEALAIGYSPYEGRLADVVSYYSGADRAHSAGSLIANVPDISKWMDAVGTNKNNLLSEQYFKDKVLDVNNYTNVYQGHKEWNLGFGLGFDQPQNAFFHLGNIEGYECHAIYSRNEGVSISVCVNGATDLVSFPYEVLSAIYPYRK
ncbi:MAG: Class A beta-lactamase-related serine hydrolase [uncultured Sulfurovum sp.]|uniref:Class A beta-lactamase-related serine hydrolase n=1 Tax=uncultured Sulfurovum sp. TaxID=269237 RepID=A0A6S6S377_9BACT|nr:MAG: Class A beta-lactamase-related serine hydrolase [uncultured Sulfurovum sp.]